MILKLIDASSVEEILDLLEKSFVTDFGAKESKVLIFTDSYKNFSKSRVKKPTEAISVLGEFLNNGKRIEKHIRHFIEKKHNKTKKQKHSKRKTLKAKKQIIKI